MTRSDNQREHGLFSPLARARVYDGFQNALGADVLRARIARELRFAPAGRRLRVLDVGCGTARLLDHLGDCDYVGVDASERYLAAARRRFGARGRFVCCDAADLSLPGEAPFDLALMFGFLHHVDDVVARRLLSAVAARLVPGGRLVTLDGARLPDNGPVTRLILDWDRGLHVRSPEEYRRLAEHDFGHVLVHVRRDLLRVPYTHAILECFAGGAMQ